MKRLVFVGLMLLLILLTACVSYGEVNQSDNETQTNFNDEQLNTPSTKPKLTVSPTPLLTATSKPTDTISVTQTPMQAQTIPDIMIDPANKSNSNYSLYEDEESIYYLWENDNYKGDLLIINKENGDVTQAAEGCYAFTFNNGILYYIDSNKNIVTYDGDGKTKKIYKPNNARTGIVIYSNQIFFLSAAEIEEGWEPYEDFYTVNIDGSGMKMIQEDVASFCIYDDRIFGTTGDGVETGLLFEYDEDAASDETNFGPSIYWDFDISHNKIICMRMIGNCFTYDINTGEKRDLPYEYYYAVAGQYVITLVENDRGTPKKLLAYDYLTNKEYELFDFADITDVPASVKIHASGEIINLCIETSFNQTMDMYRLNIRDGEAIVEHVVTLTNEE